MNKPFMLYLIGISGSGKTTIAEELEKVIGKKIKIEFLDGDVLRSQLGGLFGYTKEERLKNNKVVRFLISYLIKNDISVVLTQVGGYKEMRDNMRKEFSDVSNYAEIYIKCSLDTCIQRDVKGYYKKKDTMVNFNGTTDVFDEPLNSELVIHTENNTLSNEVTQIIEYIRRNGYDI